MSATANTATFLQAGQSVDFEVQIRPADGRGGLPVISGRVSQIMSRSNESIQAEIDFAVPLPERTTVGTRIGALLNKRSRSFKVPSFSIDLRTRDQIQNRSFS